MSKNHPVVAGVMVVMHGIIDNMIHYGAQDNVCTDCGFDCGTGMRSVCFRCGGCSTMSKSVRIPEQLSHIVSKR